MWRRGKRYTVTDQEVYDYLEKLKVFIEQSDNKEDAMAIIEQFDSEEDYWNYEFEVYKKDLPIQKYMAAKEKEFKEVAPQAKSINEIEEEWQDIYGEKENICGIMPHRIGDAWNMFLLFKENRMGNDR